MSTTQIGKVSTDVDNAKRKESGRCVNAIMKLSILTTTEKSDAQVVMKDVGVDIRSGHAAAIDTLNRMNRIEQEHIL